MSRERPGTSARRAAPRALSPRHPDQIFDEGWYLSAYPDVAGYRKGAWHHYVTHGDAEGRAPGPAFDPEFYARTYLELEATRPGHHYILEGRARGYQPVPQPRSADDSGRAMRAALAQHPHTVVLVGHDARRAGAPILLAELASHLRVRGFEVVFVLAAGGPLLPDYQNRGRTFVLAEGWDPAGLGSALGPHTAVIGNTAWSAPLIEQLRVTGPHLLLVHEMPDYVAEHRLTDAVRRQRTVVVATPRQVRQFADAGITAVAITPGLMSPPADRRARAAVGAALTQAWGRDRVLFLGAGYADRRKGFDLFLDAARRIRAHEPRARFVWLGETSRWAQNLASGAIAEGLPLLLPGFRDDAPAWYHHADVFLLTSRQDPGPATVMDAALVGVPFVALAADVGLRSLDPGLLRPIGRFVDPSDPDAFAAEALATARHPGDRRRRAAWVARHASFAAYATAIVDRLRADDPRMLEPPPVVQSLRAPWHRLRRLRRRLHRARARLRETALRQVVGAVPGRRLRLTLARALGGVLGGASIVPVSVAVTDGEPPAHALRDAESVRHLAGGDRVWVGDVELLRHLSQPAVVHYHRHRTDLPPAMLGTLADAAPWIVELRQHRMPGEQSPAGLPRTDLPDAPPPAAILREPEPARPPSAVALRPLAAPVRLPRPVGIFLHLFHEDLAPVLAERLAAVDHPARLYVSTDTEAKAVAVRRVFPDAEVRVMPNVGRDMYPKLYGFADAYAHHDVVLHLHSKRSVHDPALEGWFAHILDRLLGTTESVNAILSLFAEAETVGMVSPAPYPRILPSYGWTTNRPLAELLTWERGWAPLPDSRSLAFPAGSMFWARTGALAPIRALDLGPEAFVLGDGLRDGTLPHALERLLGASCATAGLHQVFVDLPGRSLAAPAAVSAPQLAASLRRPPGDRSRSFRAR